MQAEDIMLLCTHILKIESISNGGGVGIGICPVKHGGGWVGTGLAGW